MENSTVFNGKGHTFCCAPAIHWLKDADHTLLIDTKNGQSWSLSGSQAAIWDCLTLGYPYQKTIRFLSLLEDVPMDAAENLLLRALYNWQSASIIHKVERGTRGKPGDQHSL